MKFRRLLPMIFLLANFMVAPAFAQFSVSIPGGNVEDWTRFILGNPSNMPSDWLILPNLFYFIILPFTAIVAVIYGIMTEIRIFRSQNVKLALSVAMAGMTLPSGFLIATVYWMYTVNAWLAVVAFGIVFFIGTILWATGSVFRIGAEAVGEVGLVKETYRDIRNIDGQINQRAVWRSMAMQKLATTKNAREQVKLKKDIAKWEQEIATLRAQKSGLVGTLRDTGFGT